MFSKEITEDAELRMLQPHHAEELYALVDSNRDHLRRWLPWVDSITSVGAEREFINASLDGYSRTGSFVAGVWFRGRLAGGIGLEQINWRNELTSIGYFLSEESQGKGLITSACRALVDHSFGDLGLNRIEIRVATENHRSQAVPRRLGFKKEGVLRQVEWLYDHYVDHVMFAMLSREWQELAGRTDSGDAICRRRRTPTSSPTSTTRSATSGTATPTSGTSAWARATCSTAPSFDRARSSYWAFSPMS